jgi:hypothetical protein
LVVLAGELPACCVDDLHPASERAETRVSAAREATLKRKLMIVTPYGKPA